MNAWDEVAEEWEQAASVRAYASAAFGSIQEVAATAEISLDGATVCDFGCGTGVLTERLAARCGAVDAVDSSPGMLAVLQAKIDARSWTHVRAFPSLPSVGEPYDVVVCSSVLAFVDDHPATVRALADRLRAGGLFVQFDWEAEPDDPDHAGLTRGAVDQAMREAGIVGGAVEPAFEVEADGEVLRPLRAWGCRGRGST